VQEFKVNTNTYDAQYGRTGGGVITIVTKAGGNRFHGTLFEYFQHDKLNANQTELNRAGTPKPPNNINTFGFNLTGPVVIPKVFNGRNKLFWLLSYEGMRQRSADPGVRTFPLAEWRTGDFSSLLNGQGQQVLIYDPLTTLADGTRQPFLAIAFRPFVSIPSLPRCLSFTRCRTLPGTVRPESTTTSFPPAGLAI
jgi:hypothetical protein